MDYVKNLPNRVSFNPELWGFRVWCGGKGGKQVYFTAAKYGSLKKAYRAAIDFEKSLPDQTRNGKRKHREQANARSETGVVGVSPEHSKDGEFIMGYRAFWTEYDENRKPLYRSKCFYFSSSGSQAFEKAKRYRKKMVKEND